MARKTYGRFGRRVRKRPPSKQAIDFVDLDQPSLVPNRAGNAGSALASLIANPRQSLCWTAIVQNVCKGDINARFIEKDGFDHGASRGIGRAAALAIERAGAHVLVHYGRGAKEAQSVVNEIVQSGGRVQAVSGDMSGPEGPRHLATQVRTIVGDRLDVLVANAGISRPATIAERTTHYSYCPIKGIAATSAFQSAVPSQSLPFGHTKSPTRRWPRSKVQ